jgi:hypothetical protein
MRIMSALEARRGAQGKTGKRKKPGSKQQSKAPF